MMVLRVLPTLLWISMDLCVAVQECCVKKLTRVVIDELLVLYLLLGMKRVVAVIVMWLHWNHD